jgi:hypothetical protein
LENALGVGDLSHEPPQARDRAQRAEFDVVTLTTSETPGLL